MDILVYLLVVSNLHLVLTEDNVAIEKIVAPKDTYKVHPDQEKSDFPNDQLAESSQTVSQSYGNVITDRYKEIQDETKNPVQPSEKLTSGPNDLRQNAITLNPIQVLQHSSHHQQAHQLYHYPVQQVQIFGAEASPLQQPHGNESPQALGYSSYIEHLSDKDEDEIKSALKEGSIQDIKRLVPKSGITFTIYQNGKNSETQNSGTELHHLTRLSSDTPAKLSTLHHKIRNELPTTQFRVQNEVHQTPPLEELHLTSLNNGNGEEHHAPENFNQLLQHHKQDQQSSNSQAAYYTQPEPPKTFVDLSEKSSFARPHFKINVAESNYNKQATAADLHRNLKSSTKSSKHNLIDVHNQKQRNINGKADGFQRAVKPVKNLEAVHYAFDPLAQAEGSKGVYYSQNPGRGAAGHNVIKYKGENSFVEAVQLDSGKYVSNSYLTKVNQNNFAGHLIGAPNTDKKVNLLPGNYKNAEEVQLGNVYSHMGTTGYTDHAFKGDTLPVRDSETAKSNHHSLTTYVPKSSYLDTKNIQNFDHQKALEGSTSFDIKNAIDSSGALLHQTNYVNPSTAEIHPVDTLQKQQLTYIIPKIPTSTAVIDNGVHHQHVTEDLQIKNFEHVGISPQLSYHNAPEVGGKYFYPPQTLQWTSEPLKQGIPVNAKDLHQQILRLHLPKEEFYVKTPNAEFPTNILPHVTLSQQKQPFVLHYNLPFVKSLPQELHFQPKTKTRPQTNHVGYIKLAQPVALDWSLFKSGLPDFGINSPSAKPEPAPHVQETGRKIVPILVRKRKNRSNGKQEVGIVYGKVAANRRPMKPNQRQEKNVRVNLLPEASTNVKQFEAKGDRKNEFSVSASYKVDRSSKSS